MSKKTDYKKQTFEAIRDLKDKDQFQEEDEMVAKVFEIGGELFEKDLDKMSEGKLIKKAGKLSGAYSRLSQKASKKRAERDVAEQKKEEYYREELLKYKQDTDTVTEAKSKAKLAVKELSEEITKLNYQKNNYENIAKACDRMVGFIQSALKVKQNERYRSSDNWDNS